MRVRVGTSGFSYPEWRGSFYPDGLAAKDMLAHYARQLSTVEINNTFYRMPTVSLLESWSAATPAGFLFSCKCPRRVTHQLRLGEARSALERLAQSLSVLGPKLGPVLFQLPPWLRLDGPRLRDFLAQLAACAPGLRPAFEFRHPSWFHEDVFSTLQEAGAALCIAESDKLETPLVATAPWGYLRLRRQEYSPAQLHAWAEHIAQQPWDEACVYMKHETAEAPQRAMRLLAELAANACGAPRS